MDDHDNSRLDGVMSEIVDAVRANSFAGVSDYCERYPDLADDIRALTPTLVVLEQTKSAEGASAQRSLALATGATLAGGQPLGDFQIVREIGRGGMGIVYEAIDPGLQRRVAVKALAPWISSDGRNLQRFESEARTIAGLHHPHIVPLLSVGRDRGSLYLVMQLVQGFSLDQVIAELRRRAQADHTEAPNPPSDTCLERIVERLTAPDESARGSAKTAYFVRIAIICGQAASGLQHASAHNVVHRDIKPSNLLLNDELMICITDFGMAKSADSANVTRTGEIVGTLRYLAPERLLGRCDAQSDIYGLGATLYELATLQPPFGEVSDPELVHLISAADPPSPRAIDRQIPRDLETIIGKSLAKNPRERYSRAGDMAVDLLAFAHGLPIKARKPGRLRRASRALRELANRAPVTVGVALVLGTGILVAAFFLIMFHPAENLAPAPAYLSSPPVTVSSMVLSDNAPELNVIRQHPWPKRHAFMTYFSDDGRYYWATGEYYGKEHARVWETTTGRLVFDRPASFLCYDVHSGILFSAMLIDEESQIEATHLESGRALPAFHLPPGEAVCALTPSRDGRQLISGHRYRLRIWDVESRKLQHEIPLGECQIPFLSLLPGDREVMAYEVGAGPVMQVVDYQDGTQKNKLLDPNASANRVLTVGRRQPAFTIFNRYSVSQWSYPSTGPSRRVDLRDPQLAIAARAISDDLQWALFTTERYFTAFLVNLKSGTTHAVSHALTHAAIGHHAFSPDGRYAVICSTRESTVYLLEMPPEVWQSASSESEGHVKSVRGSDG